MRKLFTILACAAAMVACENDEIVRQDLGDRIEFGNAFVDNATRAEDPSLNNTNFTNFLVWGTVNGVSIFGGDEVTGTVGSNIVNDVETHVWTCPTVNQYWIPGAAYKFAALANAEKNNVTCGDDKLPATVKDFVSDGKTDLVYAVTDVITGQPTGQNRPVTLTFSHLLSKVNFTVVNNSTTAAGYSFVVKNITFDGATKATYDVASKVWTASATDDTVLGNERTVDVDGVATKVKDIVVASGAASNELGTEVLFIPGAYTITFIVDILYDGQLVTSTNYPVAGTYTHTLAANNAYNFKVHVAVGDLITFAVTQAPGWADGDGEGTTLTL